MHDVPNDLQRTTVQNTILSRQAEGDNQPVILLKNQNKWNMVEGFHRTMAILLKGKPAQLQTNDIRNWDKWNCVLLQAWIGTPGQNKIAMDHQF